MVALTIAFSAAATAQESVPDDEIRREAREILADPEFRYFDHLGESSERPFVRGARPPMGFGGNGEGSEGEGGSGNGGPNGGTSRHSRDRSGRNPNSGSSSESGGGSSSTSIQSGGGLGAVGGAIGLLFHALAYLVLIAVCGLIVYLIVLAILNREPKSAAHLSPLMNLDVPQEEDHPPGELPADAYLAKSRQLAEQGRYREAVGQLLLGGMSGIERAALIRHRRGLTLRDYLRSLRGRAPHYDGFRSMIRLYEPVAFGRRVASHQTYQDALVGYEQTVAALA